MLNISQNKIDRDSISARFSSFEKIKEIRIFRQIVIFLSVSFVVGFSALFLPWTQNIRARGTLTSLNPQDREQTIHSMITGRVEKWYVQEGQLVQKGDTVVFISEVKAEYLDPDLIERSKGQTVAKEGAQRAYYQKGQALSQQIEALRRARILKLEQARNYVMQAQFKVVSDSIELETANINLDIAEKQFARQQTLYDQGLKSLTELEQRKQKLQESVNKQISASNKLMASKAEYTNADIGLANLENEFDEKIAKAESELMTAVSSGYEAEGEVNKLRIQQENYTRRAGFYYITAPQDGFVTRAIALGIGEAIKEGEPIFTFVPSDYDLAVEIFIHPIDLPLIHQGSRVQLQFDGWPALVFSGWPGMSVGTFTGEVLTFDRVADPDGKFRVLILPDPNTPPWPDVLRLGTGVYGIAMLKNVPVWYELWRNLNGFPPEFYNELNEVEQAKQGTKSKKK